MSNALVPATVTYRFHIVSEPWGGQTRAHAPWPARSGEVGRTVGKNLTVIGISAYIGPSRPRGARSRGVVCVGRSSDGRTGRSAKADKPKPAGSTPAARFREPGRGKPD